MTEQRQRIGYALREDFLEDGEEYLGGIVAAGDADLDIAEELAAGDGTIVIATNADPRIVTALDERPELERVDVSDSADVTIEGAGPDKELEDLTLGELRQRNPQLAGVNKARKAELVAAIRERDTRTAEGTLGELEEVNVTTLAAAAAAREEG